MGPPTSAIDHAAGITESSTTVMGRPTSALDHTASITESNTTFMDDQHLL